MLEQLTIQNFALIDHLALEFESGLNILSGETGAGKSIIVGALSFLLGVRSDPDSIRTDSDEAQVSGNLYINQDNQEALSWLEDRDIKPEDGHLLIQRSLRRNGRGTVRVQGKQITRAELSTLAAYLFDLHGQHDHENLLKPENHRRYLDRFAGIAELASGYYQVFLDLTDKRRRLTETEAKQKDQQFKLEMLDFAVQEIEASKVKIGETEDLEAEASKLSAYEKLTTALIQAAEHLYEADQSALTELRRVKSLLDSVRAVDQDLSALAVNIDELFYEAEAAAEKLRYYKDSLSFDPERLDVIQERLAQLFRLKKKYGPDEAAILAYQQTAALEAAQLRRCEQDKSDLEASVAGLERELLRRATVLTSERQKAAKALADRIRDILGGLGMPKAQFEVAVKPKLNTSGLKTLGAWGADEIGFLISANAGEDLKDLAKIASGGELSRIMLAIKTVLADTDTVETLVFDEIDAGIGGEVALAVGKHLQTIAKTKQIFCVTHLASIAVRADNHLVVEKQTIDGRTSVTIAQLAFNERRGEIARMLAGDAAGNAALAHADDLLERFGKRG